MNRTRALFLAQWQSTWGRGAWPVAPLVMHGSASAVLCLLVRDDLPPFAYAAFALSIAAALIALPLLGEFAPLLRSDPAREWIEAQPVRSRELRSARLLSMLTLVAALASASLLPIVLFAPDTMDLAARVLLLLAGFAQAAFVCAALVGVQALLGERAEALLVLLQTLLVGGVLIGAAIGLRSIPALIDVTQPDDAWLFWPPAWFGAVVAPNVGFVWRAAAPVAACVAFAILFLAPAPPAPRVARAGWLSFLLTPLRALFVRTWVRREERGSFDLVFDALPLEREFVLRTYPMIGIPLAFLLAGARGGSGLERDGLLAVLLFTPATYLPILLVQVPASQSAAARWILDGAPRARAALDNGALKALVLRFLVPLYLLLFGLAWSQTSVEFALRMAVPGFLVSLLVLRHLYPLCAQELPLSVEPNELQVQLDWTGTLLMLGLGLTVLAVLALKFLTTLPVVLAVCALLLFVEWRADRAYARAAAA